MEDKPMSRNRFFDFPVPAWVGGYIDSSELDWFLFQHGEHHRKHGRHGPLGRNWADERRTRRGDIKFILLELLAHEPSHGYNLIKEMERRYGEFRRLSAGSVYPTLQMLEEGGYLTSEQVAGKRVYSITDAGRELLAGRSAQSTSNATPGISNVPPEFSELRNALNDLAAVVMQVARSANPERMSQVKELLEQVKRDIHAVLAEK
jgi:DNA-binding PadR family transcriptional regulator